MNFIVLDANAIIKDYWLRSPSFVLLRYFLKKSKATLVVPEIVLNEVVNHHREDIDQVISDFNNLRRDVERLLPNFPNEAGPAYSLSIYKARNNSQYDKFLRDELALLGALVPDYQKISHKDLVSRDLQRKRPFQESGKGYRDALLWETLVRDCLAKNEETVFITSNKKDFCEPDGSLHRDLLDDVRHKDYSSTLKVYTDLPLFTDERVVPFLTKRKEFVPLLENKKFPGLVLEQFLVEKTDLIIEEINRTPGVMVRNTSYEPSVDSITSPMDVRVLEVSEISAELLLIRFHFETEVLFTYYLPRSDWASMSEEEEMRVSVSEPDWNEHVMQVQSDACLILSCRLIFNHKSNQVESFEMEDLERGP